MEGKNISLAVALVSCLIGSSTGAALGQGASAQTFQIHQDMLKCYTAMGRSAEQEAEYKWLLAARPSDALLHYNYACLLKTQGKFPAAGVQYEKAAQFEGSNVDYVGQCGQMMYYLKQYMKAYQYLGKAMQMPGGEKYKGPFDNIRQLIQDMENRKNQAPTKGPAKPGTGGDTKKHNDDDDD